MKLPTKLAYQRSISPSHVVFYSTDNKGLTKPLEISTSIQLGQLASASEGFDSNMEPQKKATSKRLAEGNPQQLDFCYAPPDAEVITAKFSLRIDSNSLRPLTCNDPSVAKLLSKFVDCYNKLGGYKELSSQYMKNVLSGRWLWRNQSTLNTNIEIKTSNDTTYIVQGIHRKRFDSEWESGVEKWEHLVKEVEEAFTTPSKYLLLEISAYLTMGFAQELHPSQAFLDKSVKKSSREYQSISVNNQRVPILGAYKVGAAIAMIDDWYPKASKAIRVGAFGVDKENHVALRSPETKLDLYSSLIRIEDLVSGMEKDMKVTADCHFIAANLVKGGLFQLGRG